MYNNLKELILMCGQKFKNNIAFKIKKKDASGNVYYDDVTYGRFSNEVEYLARGMMERNLSGKRVAVIGKNSYEWMVTFLATVCTGSVIVPLDRGLLDYEIADQLSRAEAAAIIDRLIN